MAISFEFVTLTGPFLAGERVMLKLVDGVIVYCDAIDCVYTDSPAFDPWFRAQYMVSIEDQVREDELERMAA